VSTLAQLHHRNIVQFYGACLETGSMFFVTELMKVGCCACACACAVLHACMLRFLHDDDPIRSRPITLPPSRTPQNTNTQTHETPTNKQGGDLYSALRHHSETMRWERLGRKVALDVALGLNYLHSQRPPMMHRDLKSPNVRCCFRGGNRGWSGVV
jgi:serine/threonine protein kinase